SGARNELAIAYYIDPAPATPARGKALESLADQSARNATMSFLIFSIVAGLIGLGIGAADGIVCHLPRRALLGGLVGLLVGFLGGGIGGLLGGLLFDPLDLVILSGKGIGADWSRFLGFLVIGAAVGAMIGLVELLSRDAWLRMVEGPLAGKEFLIFRDVMNI